MKKVAKSILVLLVLVFLVAVVAISNKKGSGDSGRLIVFHAGSLAVPFREICDEFNKCYPEVKIFREAAGSRMCARKISDLHRPCDVMASADYSVIDTLLIPEYAEWNIKFASNEMVIAFRRESRRSTEVNENNWYDVLLRGDVAFGRADPNADPCGYRTVLMMMLAEKFYDKRDLAAEMLAKDRKYIRSKEVDLLALLEAGEIDYVFIYRSVAEQHKLEAVRLPDYINLKKSELADFYKSVSVRISGKKRGEFVTKTASPIVYGVTIPNDAPNRKVALAFLDFLLDADKGGVILEKNGQDFIVPLAADGFEKIPPGLQKFAVNHRGQK